MRASSAAPAAAAVAKVDTEFLLKLNIPVRNNF